MKVVFHIDELEKWSETSKNVKNLLKASSDITIVVSVNGIAIKGYLENKNLPFIQTNSVQFHACNNAMKANKISKDDLPENVTVVPAGVLDLVELQSVGYGYVKA
ncbi:DsrE family protein [Enterococcus massiliensis]|uniref:DsrE family protein n=1 Tax=Enterococcus massiliensis TaxID=1640685 RepID=UPI00065E68C8|nr:DsrE family protein [Enterococcus massiliensis]